MERSPEEQKKVCRGSYEGDVVDVSQGKMNGMRVEFANVSREPEPTLSRNLS
jgi:hypothetical protein